MSLACYICIGACKEIANGSATNGELGFRLSGSKRRLKLDARNEPLKAVLYNVRNKYLKCSFFTLILSVFATQFLLSCMLYDLIET